MPEKTLDLCFDSMVTELASHNVILYGDFHSFKQSQKGFLSIVRALKSQSDREIIVCLEAFQHNYQMFLDQYIAGHIHQNDLRTNACYDKYWNYPWVYISSLLEYCTYYKIPTYGINTVAKSYGSMRSRDLFMRKLIFDIYKHNPEACIVVMVGELHLVERSLYGALLKKSVPVARVFSNIDRYNNIQHNIASNHERCFQLDESSFCFMNASSWQKWQSFNIWEGLYCVDQGLMEDEGEFTDIADDPMDYIRDIAHHMSVFLQVDCDGEVLSGFKAGLFELETEYESLSEHISAGVILHEDQYIIDLQKRVITIMQPSMKNFARISGILIWWLQSKNALDSNNLNARQWFLYRCISLAAGEISAKILNPHGRVYDIDFIKDFIAHHRRRKLSYKAGELRDTFRRVVKIYDRLLTADNLYGIEKMSLRRQEAACLWLGKVLGQSYFRYALELKNEREAFQSIFDKVDELQSLQSRLKDVFLKCSESKYR